jgi:arylsulfatase A-like enzyme
VDLAPTLCDWFGVSAEKLSHDGKSLLPVIRNEQDSVRETAWVGGADGQRGLRTAHHYYLETPIPEGDEFAEVPQHLFHKPFDRWDLADLARQSPGIVDELNQLLKTGPQ